MDPCIGQSGSGYRGGAQSPSYGLARFQTKLVLKASWPEYASGALLTDRTPEVDPARVWGLQEGASYLVQCSLGSIQVLPQQSNLALADTVASRLLKRSAFPEVLCDAERAAHRVLPDIFRFTRFVAHVHLAKVSLLL